MKYRLNNRYRLLAPLLLFVAMICPGLTTASESLDPTMWPTAGLNPKALKPVARSPNNVYISNSKELKEKLENVEPGQTLLLEDGEFVIKGRKLNTKGQSPSEKYPVTLTAVNPGKAQIRIKSAAGISINHPYWRITGLRFIGDCSHDSNCEHALHVVGKASHVEITNNEFIDFNASIKVNEKKGIYPDYGLIKHNHFYGTRPRGTSRSVTPINIDHGSYWNVSNNIIRDFVKLKGNKVSYGAFMKGGVLGGIFESNVVICNSTATDYPSETVGLSIGGGGMKNRRNEANYEAKEVVIRNNLILNCSDVGVYVNKGKDSVINNNIFYKTSGIDVRFPTSSATILNNIFDGRIRERDGGTIVKNEGNYEPKAGFLSQKASFETLFISAETGNFSFTEKASDINQSAVAYPIKQGSEATDFCGNTITDVSKFIGPYINSDGCFN